MWADMGHDIRDLFSYRLALLARANDRDAQNHLMSNYGVTLIEWRTLGVIRALCPCTLRQLATQGFLDEGQMSRTVKLLCERGLVERRPDDSDGRAIKLSLSEAGEALYVRVIGHVETANEETIAVLSQEERLMLMEFMQRMLDHLRTGDGA